MPHAHSIALYILAVFPTQVSTLFVLRLSPSSNDMAPKAAAAPKAKQPRTKVAVAPPVAAPPPAVVEAAPPPRRQRATAKAANAGTAMSVAKKQTRTSKQALLTDVSTESGVSLEDCASVMDAMHTVVGRHLREKKKADLFDVVRMTLKDIPAKPARTKAIFGVERPLSARGPTKKICVSVAPKLKALVV